MILLDPDRTFEVKVGDTVFTCKPILTKDMAKFMDMVVTSDKDGGVEIGKIAQRNYEVCKKYIVKADGLKLANGNKVPWRPDLIDIVPLPVINQVAERIIAESVPSEEDIKN